MSKRIEISQAIKSSGNESSVVECIMFPEELHFWSKKDQWKQDRFKKSGVSLFAVEVYGISITENVASVHRVTKSSPIMLECGVEIFDGRHGMTSQNNTARFEFRVSGVSEFNQAMLELSSKFNLNIWSITSVEIFNNKLGATIYFWRHNPNGIGIKLYLGKIVTENFDKPWESLSMKEQNEYSNNFYDEFASCALSWEPTLKKECAIKKREANRKIVRTPQSGYKRNPNKPSAA